VTIIGDISVTKGGVYTFCSPNKDGSDPRHTRTPHPAN
jgi:hypothetical protein